MGSQVSKPAKAASRKFPTRPGGALPPPHRPAALRPAPASKASFAKDDAIRADSIDPDQGTNPAFSQRLKGMGIATPNPTLSNSSIADPGPQTSSQSLLGSNYPLPSKNVTLSALEARKRIQDQADKQFENMGSAKDFVDAGTMRQILTMRERGHATVDIEKRLRLRSGLVAKLGAQGIVAPVM
ncbi:uncharacterized protein BCR38DRAFT_357691 [Pseudomassariella vexata]|uniref:Helix-turn-helix domain-containing protein n=1 Tax=Pseudomassariella vexata TaxID=1141098 RepID=A0A1Y2D5H9_9PEZI|nr:uncharacterized protein BCR38DRAFT_357691 [Pseudomassariella vexata]ORY54558.1 hypothetical protein BCR38DRAFT_357691 [Pseudomassariella vexata]